MKAVFTLLFLALVGGASPVWAQSHHPRSAKSRTAQLKSAAAARTKAEAARRAAAIAKAAAALPVTDGPEAAELMRMEEAWAQATLKNDAETITHLLAEEYVSVNSQGLVTNKADVLAAIANDEVKCDINKPFEYIVRVYNNMGLVIHNTSYRGVQKGINTSGEYRTTHVFVKRNGKWLVVSNQTTYVVPERLTLVAKESTKSDRKRKHSKEGIAKQ